MKVHAFLKEHLGPEAHTIITDADQIYRKMDFRRYAALAIGTILDPKGPVIRVISNGGQFYGEATILGAPYMTGYEPIKDASDKIIGIYYAGYKK